MAIKWPYKDPEELLDYGFNWTPRSIDDDLIQIVTGFVVTPDATLIAAQSMVATAEQTAIYNADTVKWNAANPNEKRALTKPGQMTIHWLDGGVAGETYLIQLHAITTGGRELDQQVSIQVKERV